MKLWAGRIGVDQGSVLFSDFDTGGPMWTGEGAREARALVRFAEPFLDVPVVHVSLSMWDMDSSANARADVEPSDATPEGFTLTLRTWGDTRIARARAAWLAVGPARDDEDWDAS